MLSRKGKVTVIGTFHQERGSVNASELNEILMRLQPEVIFVEESPLKWKGLEAFFITKPVESGAISQYIEARSVELVPVDLFTEHGPYVRNVREVFTYVEKVSHLFCQLLDNNQEKMTIDGFAYLNGELHDNIQLDIHNEVLRILELRGSRPLDEAFSSWMGQDERREVEMIANIEKYALENSFEKAVFLVGAGHRASLMKKIKENELSNSTTVNWDFIIT